METFEAKHRSTFELIWRASGIPITPQQLSQQCKYPTPQDTVTEQPCRMTKNRENRNIHRWKATFVTY